MKLYLDNIFWEQFIHVFQQELEAAKSEIQKWHSAFQYRPATPTGMSPGFFTFLNTTFFPFVRMFSLHLLLLLI